ncbi:MAG TPA: Type 1 glutamine amidotransferase-like domain-containing protein [Rhizomicrobium sp.]|nr:Type 1 glutamine amidotransferase-like domain-containing protein [Rhizomicrobium sp.]
MRLYLSSYRFGDRVDLLLAMVGQGARVGVIANALDAIPPQSRADYAHNVYDPIAALHAHGFDACALDLRDHFGKSAALEAELSSLDLVWATGGNAFLLRRAMRQSGFDELIGRFLAADRLAYGGESAGAVVACPNLKGIELMDDPSQLAAGYDAGIIWEGLDLLPFHLVPHYDSAHPETEAAEKVTFFMLDQAMAYRTMRDGDVLIRDAAGIRAYER